MNQYETTKTTALLTFWQAWKMISFSKNRWLIRHIFFRNQNTLNSFRVGVHEDLSSVYPRRQPEAEQETIDGKTGELLTGAVVRQDDRGQLRDVHQKSGIELDKDA